jgi:hypothetical protein
METYQIVAGFSDLKVLFRTVVNDSKTMEELELWFTFDGEVLWMHDYGDHKKCMILAVMRPSNIEWSIFVPEGTYGRKLIVDTIGSTAEHPLGIYLNRLYNLFGFRIHTTR